MAYLKSGDIGRTKSELSGSLDQVQSCLRFIIIQLHLLHNLRSAIRGIVINNQNVKIFRKAKYRIDDCANVFALFIRGDNDYGVVH